MKKLVIFGATAVAVVATPLIAQVARDTQSLTRAEVQSRVRDSFVRIDANRDGFVTQAEGQAFRSAVRGDRREQRQDRREARFARLDANRDGMISRAEFFARRDRAERGDRAERREARRERRAERRERRMERREQRGIRFGARAFERMDSNRDGRVSLAEATALRLQRFDRIDRNRDGRITPNERLEVRGPGRPFVG